MTLPNLLACVHSSAQCLLMERHHGGCFTAFSADGSLSFTL